MLSNQRLSSRKSLYLITSSTGVFAFRWNLRVNGKHHQPTLSLKTRDYLQAVKLALEIAIRIQQITLPTLKDIKSIYSDFKKHQNEHNDL